MTTVTLNVNGKTTTREVAPETLLIDFLRETLGLTGAHQGCNSTQCGACTVHVDGKAVKSCAMLALECEGQEVTTVEGLASGPAEEELHPMQAAFRRHHGLQCGFCTSGMIMTGIDIASRHHLPGRETIRAELKGNICRCTGYHNIVRAVEYAGAKMRGEEPAPPDWEEGS